MPKISALTAGTTLVGTEVVPVVQGGATVKSTIDDIAVRAVAYDIELAAIAGLTSAADKVPYFTGSGTAALASSTTFGRSAWNVADAAALRTLAGLGTIATQAAASVSISGGTITGITDLAVADGGTGASTASGARTNLGLVIATDVAGAGAVTGSGLTMATARLLGRTTASTGAIEEITVGTGLSLSAGSLTATGGAGTVTTTGSPASGNLAKFSGATSIVNGDLSGDVTTSGTLAATIANDAVTYAKMQNASAGNVFLARAAATSGDYSEVALAASQLAGRGSSGDITAIALGAGLSMSGGTLSASGSVGTGAMVLLATVTPGAVTAVNLVTGLAATYTHLRIVGTVRSTVAATSAVLQMTLNGDAGANYRNQRVYGNNATASAAQGLTDGYSYVGDVTGGSVTAGYASSIDVLIPLYAGTSFNKTVIGASVLANGTGSGNFFRFDVGTVWVNTAAITQVDMTLSAGNFATGSTFSLYGVY